jgi:stage II sporulation protein D
LKKSVLYEKLIQAYPHLQEEQSATWSQLNPETITGVMEEQPETWAQQTTEKQLSEDAQTDVDAGSGAEANQLTATIAVRNSDGRVETLCVANENAVVTVQGEYEIRQLLGGPDLELTLMDGSCISDGTLLPSAYFYLNDQGDSWEIRGGGDGHGNGMSQCGAAALAEKGMDYQEIIGYYYSETTTG